MSDAQMKDYFADEIYWNKACGRFLNRLIDLNMSDEFQDEFLWIIKNARYHD